MGVRAQHGGKYKNNLIQQFIPQHPEKLLNRTQLIAKSNLEYLAMRYLDSNPIIKKWGYESKFIYYYDRLNNRRRRYFIDFIAIAQLNEHVSKELWIEIKPYKETIPPKNKKDFQGQRIYMTNKAKWDAATVLAKQNGAEFKILTENELKLH